MRQTIIRRRHKIKKDRLFTFFAFFVLAPLISILLGFALVNYIILPRFLPTQKEPTAQILQDDIGNDNVESQQNTQEINSDGQSTQGQDIQIKQSKAEGVTLYNIQVGNFSSIENAENLAKELKTKGVLGYVVKLDSYKVFTGTYLTREEADVYLANVKNSYSDAFISTFSIIERVISYNEDEQDSADNMIDVMYAVDIAYNEEMRLLGKAIETKEVKLFLDTMTNNTNNLESMIQKLNTGLKSDQLVQLTENLQNHISQRKKIIDDLKNNGIESLSKSYIDFYTNYFEYVSFTK